MRNKSILITIMALATCSIPIILTFRNINTDTSNVEDIEEVYLDISKQEPNEQNNPSIEITSSEKVQGLINDLARYNEVININGERVRISEKAEMDLRKIGEPVIPYLVKELKTNRSENVRKSALSIIYSLINEDNKKLMEYLPVFVSCQKDKEQSIRLRVAVIIGEMAKKFKFNGTQENLDKVIPYLVVSLNDMDKDVKYVAGEYFLKQITKEDIVKAFNELDNSPSQEFDFPMGYYIVYKEKQYPPIAIIRLAAKRMLGRPLEPTEYSVDEELSTSLCKDVLRNLGFEISNKDIGK